jgi:iron uptake system EfeUOB component EfeO/EfeM
VKTTTTSTTKKKLQLLLNTMHQYTIKSIYLRYTTALPSTLKKPLTAPNKLNTIKVTQSKKELSQTITSTTKNKLTTQMNQKVSKNNNSFIFASNNTQNQSTLIIKNITVVDKNVSLTIINITPISNTSTIFVNSNYSYTNYSQQNSTQSFSTKNSTFINSATTIKVKKVKNNL